MIKAVLFDLDNTLINFRAMKNNAAEAAIGAMIDSGLKLEHKEATKLLFEMYEEYGIENQLIFNKRTLAPTFAEPAIKFPASLKILQKGMLDARQIITHTFKLDDYDQAIQTAESASGGKVVFKI